MIEDKAKKIRMVETEKKRDIEKKKRGKGTGEEIGEKNEKQWK